VKGRHSSLRLLEVDLLQIDPHNLPERRGEDLRQRRTSHAIADDKQVLGLGFSDQGVSDLGFRI